ncbi:g7350 [Coccomyxa elongata]
MFPHCFRIIDIVIILSLATGSSLVTLIGAPLGHYDLNNTLLVILPSIVTAGVTITTAFASARHTGNKVDAARYLCMFLMGGVVVYIYSFLMPTLVTSRTSINQLLILRLVVHPTIWSILIVQFSNTVRHIGAVPNLMQAVLWIWPVMYKSIYGRFLLLQLGNTSNIMVLNVLISVYSVAGRLASRQGSGMLLQLMYGTRTAEAISATNTMNQIRLAELFASTIAEHAGIVAASAVYSFGRVSGNGDPPNHYNIWMSALCQLLTTIVADFVSLACDWKYHSIDYFTHWVSNMRKFLTYILIVITLGSSRLCVELLMLFCPTFTKDNGVLLYYCDKPSLFGRIGKSGS